MKLPENIASFKQVLFAQKGDVISFQLNAIGNISNFSSISGVICGGNRLLFGRMMATKFAVSLLNKILVLEHVYETPQELDGFLDELSLKRDFEDTGAIIFGTFSPAPEIESELFQRIIEDFANRTSVPVFQLVPEDTIGHESTNKAMPLGVLASIEIDQNNQLLYLKIEANDFIQFDNIHDEL